MFESQYFADLCQSLLDNYLLKQVVSTQNFYSYPQADSNPSTIDIATLNNQW